MNLRVSVAYNWGKGFWMWILESKPPDSNSWVEVMHSVRYPSKEKAMEAGEIALKHYMENHDE